MINQQLLNNLTTEELVNWIEDLYLDNLTKEELYYVLRNVQERIGEVYDYSNN